MAGWQSYASAMADSAAIIRQHKNCLRTPSSIRHAGISGFVGATCPASPSSVSAIARRISIVAGIVYKMRVGCAQRIGFADLKPHVAGRRADGRACAQKRMCACSAQAFAMA